MTRRTWKRIALATVFLTVAASLLLRFNSGESRIEEQIPSVYGVEDPHFVHTMGSLLGPSLLPGNRVVPLVNGDQIFAAMLQAIEGAKKDRSVLKHTFIGQATSGKVFPTHSLNAPRPALRPTS